VTAPIVYLFDPFCGWCYAAAPQIARLREAVGRETVYGLPVGLFVTDGQTPMTPEFRDYAWSNDQRIAEMTGQPFSQAYYTGVLSNFAVPFDSGPPTKAIAVAETWRPQSGLDLLARLQKARFVEGCTLFDPDEILALVEELGFDRAEFAQRFSGPEGTAALERTLDRGQIMMQRLGLRGVPALALGHGDHYHPIQGDALIDPHSGLVEKLAAQFGAGGTGLGEH
jgi:putative protein-disulfide isomerase